jgi:hypothetical protein
MKEWVIPVELVVWGVDAKHALDNMTRDLESLKQSSDTATSGWRLIEPKEWTP